MAVGAIPERIRWAVETMAVDPADRLLEIGCGRGTAVHLVCQRLVEGKITAIDRSLTMVKIAEERNSGHVASGRAAFQAVPLDAVDLSGEQFDKVFAINVNLFWVRSSAGQAEIVRGLLKPDGTVFLCYEPPGMPRAKMIAERVSGLLTELGFAVSASFATTRRSTALLCLTTRPIP